MSILTIPNSISVGLFSARMAVSQSVTASTLTTAVFDGELFDTRNQYNNSTGIFTCSVPGYWQFNSCLRMSSTTAITNAILQITHNSTGYRTQQTIDPSSTCTTFGLSASIILQLAASDTVQIQGFAATSGTLTFAIVGGGLFASVFSGYLVAST